MPAPTAAASVLDHLGAEADVIVPLANGEPVALLDAIEALAEQVMRARPPEARDARIGPTYLHGAAGDRLRHVGW